MLSIYFLSGRFLRGPLDRLWPVRGSGPSAAGKAITVTDPNVQGPRAPTSLVPYAQRLLLTVWVETGNSYCCNSSHRVLLLIRLSCSGFCCSGCG